MKFFRTPAVGFYVSKVAPAAIALVMVPIWLRIFGAAAFAQYAAWLVAIQIASSLSAKWLQQAELRYSGSEALSIVAVRWRHLLVVGAAISVVGTIVVALSASLFPSSSLTTVFIGSLTSMSLAVYTTLQAVFQRRLEVKWYAIAETARSLILATSSLGLWATGVGAVSALLLANFVSYSLGAVLLVVKTRQITRVMTGSDRQLISTFFSFGWPLAIWACLAVGVSSSDRLLGPILLGSAELANYSWASDFAVRTFTLLIFPVTLYVHPLIMAAHNSNSGSSRQLYNLAMRRLAIAIALLTVIGGVLLHVLSSPVFGNEGPGLPVVLVLFLSAGLWQLAQVSHKRLEIAGKTVLMLLLVLMSFTLSVVSQVLLAEPYGPLGLAIGLSVGSVSYCLATWAIGTRISKETGS